MGWEPSAKHAHTNRTRAPNVVTRMQSRYAAKPMRSLSGFRGHPRQGAITTRATRLRQRTTSRDLTMGPRTRQRREWLITTLRSNDMTYRVVNNATTNERQMRGSPVLTWSCSTSSKTVPCCVFTSGFARFSRETNNVRKVAKPGPTKQSIHSDVHRNVWRMIQPKQLHPYWHALIS